MVDKNILRLILIADLDWELGAQIPVSAITSGVVFKYLIQINPLHQIRN